MSTEPKPAHLEDEDTDEVVMDVRFALKRCTGATVDAEAKEVVFTFPPGTGISSMCLRYGDEAVLEVTHRGDKKRTFHHVEAIECAEPSCPTEKVDAQTFTAERKRHTRTPQLSSSTPPPTPASPEI